MKHLNRNKIWKIAKNHFLVFLMRLRNQEHYPIREMVEEKQFNWLCNHSHRKRQQMEIWTQYHCYKSSLKLGSCRDCILIYKIHKLSVNVEHHLYHRIQYQVLTYLRCQDHNHRHNYQGWNNLINNKLLNQAHYYKFLNLFHLQIKNYLVQIICHLIQNNNSYYLIYLITMKKEPFLQVKSELLPH